MYFSQALPIHTVQHLILQLDCHYPVEEVQDHLSTVMPCP